MRISLAAFRFYRMLRSHLVSISIQLAMAEAALAQPTIVYENTLGTNVQSFQAGAFVADDIYLTVAPGCTLDRYEIEVQGQEPFGLDVALYDRCPGQGGQAIAGTEKHFEIAGGDPGWITVTPPATDIALPSPLWLGVNFNAPGSWIGGAPALVGFSDDLYFDALLGCTMAIGRFPASPHSSFNARIYTHGACPPIFMGYRASGAPLSSLSPGAGIRFADDIALGVPACNLIGYELAVRGAGQFDVDLRLPNVQPDGFPASIIGDTPTTFTSNTGGVSFIRKFFSPPVAVPQHLWATMSVSTSFGGALLVIRPPRLGTTDTNYAVEMGGTWERKPFEAQRAQSMFQVTIWCEGESPRGACCDMYLTDANGDSVCRDVPRINCPYPEPDATLLPTWKIGQTCASAPFDHPCGQAACCRADATCENMTKRDCMIGGTLWTRGDYCDNPKIECGYVCVVGLEPCTVVHASVGCADAFCCQSVCQSGELGVDCCLLGWDSTCVQIAAEHCAIPPGNDECAAPAGTSGGAVRIDVSGVALSDGVHATTNANDPLFCCNDPPDAAALGTVWYKFIAPGDTVELDTCTSSEPAHDSLMQVFATSNPSTDATACASLIPIACNDDAPGCSDTQANSRICLRDLSPGATYYVMVGAKNPAAVGSYRLEARTSCSHLPQPQCACPTGTVEWLDPPSGFIDPRRVFDPAHPTTSLGLKQLRARMPSGAARNECWSVCGRDATGTAIDIEAFHPLSDGTTLILLTASIAAGTKARVSYSDGQGAQTTATLAAHPGNSNGDGVTNPSDVLFLIDQLRAGLSEPPEASRLDIDRSGKFAPLDVLDLIDLLTGAGAYSAWNNTSLPADPQCP